MTKKKIILLTIICIVLLAVLAIAFYLYLQTITKKNTFTLYKESGEVLYGKGQSSYQEMSTDEVSLENGTYVKTKEGEAHVIFADESMMSLDNNTEIQVQFTGETTNIKQLLGNTWHRIQKLAGNKSYTVETPTAIASVRGTKFWVSNNKVNEESDLLVKEGEVKYDQVANENGKKVVKETQSVGIGKFAKVFKYRLGTKILLTNIPVDKKTSSFFKRNELRDRDFDNIKGKNFIKKWVFREKLKQRSTIRKVIMIKDDGTKGLIREIIRNQQNKIEQSMDNKQSSDTPTTLDIISAEQTSDTNSNIKDINFTDIISIKDNITSTDATGKVMEVYIKSAINPQFCKEFSQYSQDEVISKTKEAAKQFNITYLTDDQYKIIVDQIRIACAKQNTAPDFDTIK